MINSRFININWNKIGKGPIHIQITFYLKWVAFCGISVALLADSTVCVQKYLCQCH